MMIADAPSPNHVAVVSAFSAFTRTYASATSPVAYTLPSDFVVPVTTHTTASHVIGASDPEAWFWSEQWQAGEVEANADIANGNGVYHDSDEDFLASL